MYRSFAQANGANLYVAIFLAILPAIRCLADDTGVAAPAGFDVELFADDELAHDIYSLTIDSKGRVVVSGAGYVRILIDEDNNGRADSYKTFANGPATGAQGLFFDGSDLICVGDAGVLRYRDQDGNDQADGPAEILLRIRTGGEHHAHAIRRGPDGCWYLLAGNDAGVTKEYVTDPHSPVKNPQAGVVMKFSPDFATCGIVLHGLRNAYDFDFHPSGAAFVYDSDDERDVTLPWYRPTRVFQLVPGAHAGWVSRSWKYPDYYPDMPPVVAHLGRGSPTGVVCYRHVAFPESYRSALFVADWTFGRVYSIPLRQDPATAVWSGEPQVFLHNVGQHGFAPTDLEVGSDGALYVSVGGRGTRGGVLRVVWHDDDMDAQDQSVSHAAELQPPTISGLAKRLEDSDPRIRASAIHLLLASGGLDEHPELQYQIRKSLNHDSRLIRQLASRAASDLAAGSPSLWLASTSDLPPRARVAAAITVAQTLQSPDLAIFDMAHDIFLSSKDDITRLEAVRLMQLALGDVGPRENRDAVFDGYAPRLDLAAYQDQLLDRSITLAGMYPTGNESTNRELERLLAMLSASAPEIIDRVLSHCSGESSPTDDIHYLIVLARLGGSWNETQLRKITSVFAAIEHKVEKAALREDRNWAPRMHELCSALMARDRKFALAFVSDGQFGHPAHATFLDVLKGDPRQKAIDKLLSGVNKEAISPELLVALGESPLAKHRKALRQFVDIEAVSHAAISALARRPEAADRAFYYQGLKSNSFETIVNCVAALERLPRANKGDEFAALITALIHLEGDRPSYEARERVARLLEQTVPEAFGFVFSKEGYRPQPTVISQWKHWLSQKYPKSSAEIAENPLDLNWLDDQLAAVDWSSGNATRGEELFQRKGCNQCHNNRGAIGPDLVGVTERFALRDLFTAIAFPSLNVSTRYQTTVLETNDGQVYHGAVVYDSVDGVTLITSTNRTVRVDAADIAQRQTSPLSLMPDGLLEGFGPQDYADLMSYLKSLK